MKFARCCLCEAEFDIIENTGTLYWCHSCSLSVKLEKFGEADMLDDLEDFIDDIKKGVRKAHAPHKGNSLK